MSTAFFSGGSDAGRGGASCAAAAARAASPAFWAGSAAGIVAGAAAAPASAALPCSSSPSAVADISLTAGSPSRPASAPSALWLAKKSSDPPDSSMTAIATPRATGTSPTAIRRPRRRRGRRPSKGRSGASPHSGSSARRWRAEPASRGDAHFGSPEKIRRSSGLSRSASMSARVATRRDASCGSAECSIRFASIPIPRWATSGLRIGGLPGYSRERSYRALVRNATTEPNVPTTTPALFPSDLR